MKLAVTDHVVRRYRERVQGAEDLEDESVREVVRGKIVQAFQEGNVKPHPTHKDRKLVPFKAGDSHLFFSVGPNITGFPGDMAVIGVLYDKELGGKKDMGITLGEVIPDLKSFQVAPAGPPKYVIVIGYGTASHDITFAKNDEELELVLSKRRPDPSCVWVYENQKVEIETKYVVQKRK